MSSIRNSAVALTASLALGAGIAVTAPATDAQAACSGVQCSMSHARKVDARKAVFGARNQSVRELQAALRAVGLNQPVTGYFGTTTRSNIRKYQASRRIAVTGTANSSLMHALRVGAGAKAHVKASPAPKRVSSASRSSSRPAVKGKVAKGSSFKAASSSRAQQAVAYAYSKLGNRYVYGSTGPNTFDCSGLTQAAWRSAGVSIPRTSYAQYSGLRKVSLSNLQPGDVISFYGGGHVGIYVGNGYVIHAPNSRSVVKKVKMNTMPVRGAVRPA